MIEGDLSEITADLGWCLMGAGCAFRGVSTDSRTIRPGQLFVALAGERFDGHRFVAEAVAGGASGAVVSEARLDQVKDGLARHARPPVPLAVVDDTLLALGDLARWYMRRLGTTTAGITGSTGKTTTKDMLVSVLSMGRRAVATPESYNNEVGLPLAILGLSPDCEAFVAEMAMRGKGQIAYLARMARPRVGVVLNVGTTHLELLGSVEAIAQAKAELIDALPPDGAAVLNRADPLVMRMAGRCRGRVVTFDATAADGAAADVTCSGVRSRGLGGVRFELVSRLGGREDRAAVDLPTPGLHNVSNALAAAAAGLVMGVGLDTVAAGLARVRRSPHRLAARPGLTGFVVLDDSYNASPTSVLAALDVLLDAAARRGGRAVAVLADMLELGDASRAAHLDVGRAAARTGVSVVVAVGELASLIARGFREESGLREEAPAMSGPPGAALEFQGDERGRREAAAAVLGLAGPGDVVLVKGSHSMKMGEVVSALVAEVGEVGRMGEAGEIGEVSQGTRGCDG